METIVQFLRPGDAFMARGQQHYVEDAERDGLAREVRVRGRRADGELFEATFDWDETVETLSGATL